MKTTRFCTIALTAIVGIGLACGVPQAKGADDDHSVYNWGPWGKMITPAAGPPQTFVTQLPEGFDYQSALNPRLVVPAAAVVPPVVDPPTVEPPTVDPPPVVPPIEERNRWRHRDRGGNGGNY